MRLRHRRAKGPMRIDDRCFKSIFATVLVVGMVQAIAFGVARARFAGFDPEAPVGAGVPATTGGDPSSVPSLSAHPIAPNESINVDGRLDDSGWANAQGAAGFRVSHPDWGKSPSEPTVFKVAYDTDAVYFAIACAEDPSKIVSPLTRRDRLDDSDVVSVYIDPYNDKTTGYNFRVNPRGVQSDSYIYNDGESDPDWDAVWQAETYRDGEGWYAEMRIPFSSIRYRKDSHDWGLQVYRYMHNRGEDTAWALWPREQAGFVSRFGRLTNFNNVPAPRELEFLPYAVVRATDPSARGPEEIDGFENIGTDLKFGITSDLKLNATVQPDFGQVEADPATLNLSPFETFFEEKRPFFIEGNRFFETPSFDLFYSRRIGTGDENARIRYAAKLTGKTAGSVSLAMLAAATDVTQPGQTHNVLKSGEQQTGFFVARLGKEFAGGRNRVNLMQTAVLRAADRSDVGDLRSREAYTTGADFAFQTSDRAYSVNGTFVGSIIDREKVDGNPSASRTQYGTGGQISLNRNPAPIRGNVWGRWESDRLEINDLGYLQSPDEIASGAWVQWQYNPDGKSRHFNRGNLNFNFNKSWLYSARTGDDLQTGAPVWRTERWHRQWTSGNVNGWTQLRNYREIWGGVNIVGTGTQRYETRSTVLLASGRRAALKGGGPLIDEPFTYGGWIGGSTDTRKSLVGNLEASLYRDTARNVSTNVNTTMRWNASSAFHQEVSLGYGHRSDDTQHIENFENPGGGIGGVSYVFGKIRQRTLDLTLRSSLLFDRNQSLEVYAQPFLTVGDYRDARELVAPDSYKLRPYSAQGFDVNDSDFNYGSVNVNVVYRWEYRPGSTFYLVWTHSRFSYDERAGSANPAGFDTKVGSVRLFRNEPENVLLAKISYWLPV